MNRKGEIPEGNANLEGRYANYFKIGHNAFEFLIDFGQLYPESEEAQIHIRIITSPAYAKALLETLEASVKQYEQVCGTITAEADEEAYDKGRRKQDVPFPGRKPVQ